MPGNPLGSAQYACAASYKSSVDVNGEEPGVDDPAGEEAAEGAAVGGELGDAEGAGVGGAQVAAHPF